MGFDKNTVLGFVLIGLLMMGLFIYNSKMNLSLQAEQKRIADSLSRVKTMQIKKDSVFTALQKSSDSLHQIGPRNVFLEQSSAPEQLTTLENKVIKIVFTNKGAQPKKIELKQYKTFDGSEVVLLNDSFSRISYPVKAGDGQVSQSAELNFGTPVVLENADKSQSLIYTLKDSSGKSITHTFTLHADDYMMDFVIAMNGANQLIDNNTLNLLWKDQAKGIEKNFAYEKSQMQVAQLEDGNYDFESVHGEGNKKFEKPLDWISVKQQFFISSIVAKNKFQDVQINWMAPQDTGSDILMQSTANLKINSSSADASVFNMQLYYGPSDYHILSAYNNGMQQIVPYGSGLFAFVKYINRYMLLPVFDFLKSRVVSMGIVILLLTFFIRLLTSPILYNSYLSGAKMKALKPEIDKLKEKCGDDRQALSMEQMKLWKSAGVNPLGGCIPAVLQLPIFMSLYYFFQSNIALRGQSFLWAKDLSTFDSIYSFGDIPLISSLYGNHISLFTLTATLTSLLISVYSMSNVQDNSMPGMKYMPYIFPVMLLGIFNRLPAALTWYYTISNVITLILQIIIQKYVIDHDKIIAQLEENRKKPVKMSKLQQRIQEMQEANQKVQDLKSRPSKK